MGQLTWRIQQEQSDKNQPLQVSNLTPPQPPLPAIKKKFSFGLLVVALLFLILAGGVVLYFIQDGKVSAKELPPLEENRSYDLNPIYALPQTLNWKEYKYQSVKIKYPPEWQIKEFDIGKGPALGISRPEGGNKDSGFIFADLTVNKTYQDCKVLLDQAAKQVEDTNNASNNQNGPRSTTESGSTTIQGTKVDLLLTYITLSGFSWKNLNFCFTKKSKEYGGYFQEIGLGRDFKYFKEFMLMLNKMEFN